MSANRGASTWEMLRQKSKESGYDVQALATNYVIERFIARLMVGNGDGAISVKGGQSLGILFGNQMRPTKDLDINIEFIGDETDREARVVNAVRAACELATDDGVAFNSEGIEWEWRKHQGDGGLRISMPATIHTSRVPFLIDIGIGNEMTFAPIQMSLPGVLSGRKSAPPATNAVIYPMENTLAEKLVSKFEDGSASIRHKDFFDLWLLIATLRRIGDFSVLDASASDEEDLRSEVRGRLSDGSLLEMPCRDISDACKGRLSLAMARTSAHRGTTIPDDVAAFLEDEFANDSVQPRQWANWLRNNGARLKYKPPGQGSKDSLATLVADVGPFLEEIAAIARNHAAEPTARISAF